MSDADDGDVAEGGYLSAAARRAGVQSAMRLIGRYFSEGAQPLSLDDAAGAETSDDRPASTHAIAGIRLRVAIAAASRLIEIVDRIERRPNFRYEVVSRLEVGGMTGQLDVARWLARRSAVVDNLAFPTLQSTRSSRTPDNVLVLYSLTWMATELQRSLRASTARPRSVEARETQLLLQHLKTLSLRPTYAQCADLVTTLRSDRAVTSLAQQVGRRAHRRAMRNSSPYAELAVWILEAVAGKAPVGAGDMNWAFYGRDFDRTLFEMWCLHELMRALARRLEQPEPDVHPAWAQSGTTYQFDHPAGKIDVIYQTAWSTITGTHGRWERVLGNPLGGRPDITVRVTPTNQPPTYVIIDPKLRQRAHMPTEELYKLLGYFENFAVHPRRGAILYYSTSNDHLNRYKLHAGPHEDIAAIELNPAAAETGVAGLSLAVDLICSALMD